MIYDGKQWLLKTKNEVVDKLYDDKKNYVEENIDIFCNSLTQNKLKALHRWLDLDDDNKEVTEIKDEIKLLLYNKKHIALKTKEKIDNDNEHQQVKLIESD